MKTKLSNRMISLLLCFSMLCAFILPSRPAQVHAADEVSAWNNGSIVDYVHYTGEKNYLDDAPFGYAYFYQGTDPSDTRTAGFYDMILAVNGGNSWFKDRYYCGENDAETEYYSRTAAIHMAAVTYPTYHYSTGYVFTAPYTGTVEFTYQYAYVSSNHGSPFYVMRESATGYGDALKTFTATKLANVNDKAASQYDEATFTVDVTAGEKIYFVADSDASNKAFGHWISSARYLSDADAWDNGSIVDYVHYTGEKDYLDDAPFGYAYFYQGTNPTDTRAAGFYDMILAVNGGNNWFKNRYYCGQTDAETEYNARTAAMHMAAVTYPTYHYSTGFVFTAPRTGTVAFTYQYAYIGSNHGSPFYVMRESATGYGDALKTFTATKIANVNDKAASQYDEATFTVDVTAGEKIYFVADSDASNKAFGHWISSARYLPVVESMSTDKATYREGDSITVTTTTSGGAFGANDCIAIIPEGQSTPSVQKPAAASVTFTQQLPAGKYQVVLMQDGIAGYAASATIEIIENISGLTHTPLFGVGSGQDGAIYNGKVFYFSANGICKVHDFATGEYLNYFTLDQTNVIVPHANSVCFGNTYYETGDAYPLLYVNVYNNYSTAADRREGTCCVYRLTETDGHFSTELVQVIRIGFTEDLNLWKSKENNGDVVPYGNFVIDTDNNDLYAFVMRDADQKTRFFRFKLPAVTEGSYNSVYGCNVVTLEEADIESRFDVAYFSYMQGCCYADGKIFSVEGLGPDTGTEPALRVIDLETQSIVRTEMLAEFGLNGEPEMIDIFNGKLYFISTDRCFREMTLTGMELPRNTSVTTDPTWNVGDSITVTAALSGGSFGTNDYIAIIPKGESAPVAKRAAAASVVFTEQLPAGEYQVVLVLDGTAGYAAAASIRITERPAAESWNNGNLTDRVGVHGEYLYYDSDSPFDYAFYYEGTDPNDSRTAGFHDMLMGFNGNTNAWCNYRYFCGLNTTEAANINRTAAIHLAASNAPNYHYSPGMVFTAPHSGIVEFTYQYAGLDGLNDNHTFYVMRESATGYKDALKSYKQSKIVHSIGGGEYSEDTFTVEVTAGEKIYFVVDNAANGSMSAHWISSAKYLVNGLSYTVTTDKEQYYEGDRINVTATVSEGAFGVNDYIAIVAKGESAPIAKKAAAASVSFTEELPAGEYRVVLAVDGAADPVAVKTIRVIRKVVAAEGTWNNGNISNHVGALGEYIFYADDSPFGYAFYYEGTDPEDTRPAGFHDMILASNGGVNTWCDNRYFCGLNAAETANINRVVAIHLAAANAPNYHYSPGVVFTAPYSGTVEFTYQYAGLDDLSENHTFYVMRESASGYGDAIKSFKQSKIIYTGGSGQYSEDTFTVEVTAGEKIYFVVDNAANGSMSAHWIKSAKYLIGGASYTLSADKEMYSEGDKITVTASVSTGIFGENDYIAILADGKTEPVLKLPAAQTVVFEPSAQQLPGGKYWIMLVLNGEDVYVGGKANSVASAEILVRDTIDPAKSSWNYGTLLTRLGANGEKNYYSSSSPFGYAFFYEGTDPEDTREKGFYDMIMARNGGANTWCNNRYFCGLNAAETANINRVAAIHLAAANAPNYHYSPGLVFTAPYTGTVRIAYQFAGLDAIDGNHTFYVMRESAEGYSDALHAFKATKTVYSNGTGRAYDEEIITIDVTAGENIYFIVDNAVNGGMSAHWISTVQYLDASGKPLGVLGSPITADSFDLGIWLTALVCSAIGICTLTIVNVRSRKRKMV